MRIVKLVLVLLFLLWIAAITFIGLQVVGGG